LSLPDNSFRRVVGIEFELKLLEWILCCVDKGTKAIVTLVVVVVDSARINDRSSEQPIRLVKPCRLKGSHTRLCCPLVVPILIAIVVVVVVVVVVQEASRNEERKNIVILRGTSTR
jgi:hypothetical protein